MSSKGTQLKFVRANLISLQVNTAKLNVCELSMNTEL